MKLRLTKEFRFETSHALDEYQGLCKNLHGHSYRLFVTVIGEYEEEAENNDSGMVLDFKAIKTIVEKSVVEDFDHAVVLCKNSSFASALKQTNTKLILFDKQPTCENLIMEFHRRITSILPKGIKLARLRLHETETSYAEWLIEDNE
ncbi:MAG: 6-carboxytetrahydropterin synthase [Bacteroidales bacterium]|nr:6-carboxytetrahydropterin synthase [Bacteroidales bacterium]MBQ2397849.1 6-carboxytetrahydropterin synthase [Bacteroidales bacterium]MBQ5890984.1 6-carboxytetrahydropterin synthase [Bacteroidales bacterium]